jgi:hypothetical protein
LLQPRERQDAAVTRRSRRRARRFDARTITGDVRDRALGDLKSKSHFDSRQQM